jgi:hypothetical protein
LRVASPKGARLSMTTSATSNRRCPDGCLAVTPRLWARDVTAITGCPAACARSARATVEPFAPEFDAMTNTSGSRTSYSPNRVSPTAASRSSVEPPKSETGRPPSNTRSARRSAWEGMKPPARPASSIANASEWPVPNA